MNPVYDKAPSVLSWLEMPEGAVVLEDLAKSRREVFSALQTEKDHFIIGRLQGKMDVLNKLLDLPEKLKEHLNKLETGERVRRS